MLMEYDDNVFWNDYSEDDFFSGKDEKDGVILAASLVSWCLFVFVFYVFLSLKDEKDGVILGPTLVFWSRCETLPNRFPFMHQLNLYSPNKALFN